MKKKAKHGGVVVKLIDGVKITLIPPPRKGRISSKAIREAVERVRKSRLAPAR